MRYLELLEISKFRSTIWEHVRREISSCQIKSSTNVSPETSQNYTRRELTDERHTYRFRRIRESPPRQRNKPNSSSRKSSQKDYYRERSPKQDYRTNSKERNNNRSRSHQVRSDLDEHDKKMNITVVSCCCEILGIAEVSESIRTQITSLLVLALDYEKNGMHSGDYIMTKENMEFFKLVRNKIKESLDAGHITSKRSNVIEDIIKNISILIKNTSQWMTLHKHDTVIASLTSRCISPIRAPLNETLEDPDAMFSSSYSSPSYSPTCSIIVSPMYSIESDKSEILIKDLPSSSNVDLFEEIGTINPPTIVTLTEVNEQQIVDRLKIVRSLSVISSLSSDSATMPPGVSDYECEVMRSKPSISVSSQDSMVPVEVSTSCEDTPELPLNNDNQEHEYMNDLTDDELKYLLKNFKQLTDDEQQCLIIFLENIDNSGDENRMKVLKNYMLNCEEDSEGKEPENSDLSCNIAESIDFDTPTEVLDLHEVTKEVMSDINFINDPPILPKTEKKQWKTFKVTLNVEDSLRKVDLVEDKDAVINAQMQ